MVLEQLKRLLTEQYGCDEDEITLSATLDDLNLVTHERSELALVLEELFGVEIPGEALDDFETVEDMVGYIEDRM